jgi:uncharacterized protein
MIAPVLTMALLMGLTGSLHCAGMCGPIIWVMPFQFMSGARKWLGIGLYHLGRISVYALLGVILHSFKGLFDPHVQQYVSIVLGVALLLAGIVSFQPGNLKIELPWSGWVRQRLGKLMTNISLSTLFGAGVLNGLLPCGLVYMALSTAVLVPDRLTAALAMYAFGLGTVPMLVGISIFRSRFAPGSFSKARKFVPVIMLAFGLLFVVRGMNLGIPYLSPKIEVVESGVKASCCHKK